MLQILPTDHPAALVLRVSGTVDAMQNAGALGVLRRMIRTHGRVGVLVDLTEAEHIERDALRQGLAFVAEDRHAIHALAILGDGQWADNIEALAREHTRALVGRFGATSRPAALAFACRPPFEPAA